MKKVFSWLLMAVSITCFIACDKEDKGGESSQVDKGITTYANLNPADPVILDVSNKIPLQKVAFKLDISASSVGNPESAG